MVCRVGSPLVDRRTARLSVGLAVAGSLMLTAGLGIWAVSALSHAIPHSEHTVAWLAAVALITAGACCGVLMIVVLLGSAGRNAEPAEPSWPSGPGQRGPLPPGAQLPGLPRPGPRVPPPGPPTVPPGGPPPSAGPRRPDPAYRPDDGPELADWPDPPAGGGPGFAAGEWSGPDGGFVPQAGTPAGDWSGPAGEFTPHPEPAADGWAGPDDGPTSHDAVAADNWAAGDAGLLPGAVLGQGEWTVRESETDLDAGPGPAAEQPAEDGDADELPRRVESAFNVWGRRSPATPPEAGPAGASPPGTAAPDTAAAGPAAPLTADPDQAAGSTRDWVQHAAAQLRDADLLEPADDQVEQDPILRPPAPRRGSGPAPGWNPDSEEDWLRVLRGLRASEDS